MTHSEYEQFLERVYEDPHPCVYGHINCSDRRGGVCSDEESYLHEED